MTSPILVWLRQDLRVADNPALLAAAESGREVLCVYVLDDETPGKWKIGGASRWWLHESLSALDVSIRKLGGCLVLRRGHGGKEVLRLANEIGASAVHWNRCYEPFAIARDKDLKLALAGVGVEAKSFHANLLIEPWALKTQANEPFKVFTPFWRAAVKSGNLRSPMSAPKSLSWSMDISSDDLGAWRLKPSSPNWAAQFHEYWRPGEHGAHVSLIDFVSDRLADYANGRDRMDLDQTSHLSPHLHWGEISPAQVLSVMQAVRDETPAHSGAVDKFLSEIGWREFAHHLLYYWPKLSTDNWKSSFDALAWADDQDGFRAWTRGQTGYPIVDAGMRQLWATGYMHNRARMVCASFLVKHLLIDWRRGQDWFWDTLLDADLANNASSWQWVAGSGADASPYFRIFNPVTQGERYDPEGAYVRTWVPELAALDGAFIHKPWEAPESALSAASVQLGVTYPAPIVEHGMARARALSTYERVKSKGNGSA